MPILSCQTLLTPVTHLGNYQFTSNSSNSPGPPSHVATTARLGPIHPSQAPTLSVAIARKEAQDAILRLWPLNVRFSDYLNEGIDRQVLRTLFEELGLDAGVQSRSPSSTDMSLDVVSDTPMSPVNNGASEAIPAPTIPASSIWPVQVPVPDAIPKPVLDSTPVPKPMPTPLQAFDPSILPKTSHVPVQAPTLALQQTPSETPAVPKDNPAEERKDRIARLLAAKGSKQTATQSRIPAAPVSVTNPISQSAKPDDQSLSSLQISASTKSLSEKSKLLQQKMEALRKAREMQVAKTTSNEDPSTTVPFPVSGNPVSNLTSSSQVLMPTLQKSISMPPSSPIPYHRGSVSPKQPTVLGPHPAAVSPNPPKRPAASDLNDMSDSTAKRPFGQVRRPQPFLIDVSEDEDDAAMDLDSPELETSLLHRPSSPFKIPPLHSFSATPTNAIPRQLSMPGAITTPPVGPAGGLSKNNLEFMNKEIEMMKLRIAEAEARKKAKASRTSSPSGHLWGENTAESSKPVGRSPKKSPMLAVSTTPSETNFLGSPARSVVESPSQALPKLSKLRDAGGPVRSRSRAASERLPIIEAHRKDQLLKLEALRSQIAKMEKDIADSIKEEETLRLEAMDSKLDSDGDDADRMSEDTACKTLPRTHIAGYYSVLTNNLAQGAAPMETDSEASSDEAESPRNEVAAERDEPHTSNSSSTDESMEIQSSAVLNTITDPQDIATNELVPESNAHSLTTEDGAPDVTDSSTSAMSQGELVEASEGSEPIEADSSSDESSHTDTDEAETTVVHHAKPVEIAEATPVTSSISIGQRESPAASTREVAN